jgi:hypothetical protein
MDWIWLAGAATIVFFVGARVGARSQQKSQAPKLDELALNVASDRELMLATLRRELANYMLRIDPDRFLRLYRKARAAENAIEEADNEMRKAELTIIAKKYPMYADFDLVNTRGHVLYADALNSHALEDIEEHYLNLVKFHALQCALNSGWQFRLPATSDEELEHLRGYIRKIKDTKFKQRLDTAIAEFQAFKLARGLSRLDEPGESPFIYETGALAVRHVSHFAESRTGFHFKDTDEYALYGVFLADSRDKPYTSFYRSDSNFEAENRIDYLQIDERI